jgi:methionyl-tRNA formyltransferase
MRVVKALDAGPMMATAHRPIGPDETSDLVEQDLARLGAALLAATVDEVAAGRAVETPQDEAAATYAHRLTKEDGVVDWANSAAAIHNQIRGLYPWPHAYSFVNARRLILLRSVPGAGGPGAGVPGVVVDAHGDHLVVATGDGLLQLLAVQPEGKRPMSARDFLAGRPLAPGDRFSPSA